MLIRGFSLEFEIQDGWECQSGGGKVVAHGPSGEELIVSGSVVTGGGEPSALEDVRRALIENALSAVRDAAEDPDLVITRDLAKDEYLAGCDIWTLESRTSDGTVFFGEAVVAAGKAVVIATLEAPNEPSSHAAFRGFLRSIRV